MLQHGSCAAWDGLGVLLLGRPGTGKSDLLLRLLDRRGWILVADDQVCIEADGPGLRASCPEALSGLLEIRGIGVVAEVKALASTPLSLAVACAEQRDVRRLPAPKSWKCLGNSLPLVDLWPFEASAPRKIEAALLVMTGELRCEAGAFSAP